MRIILFNLVQMKTAIIVNDDVHEHVYLNNIKNAIKL